VSKSELKRQCVMNPLEMAERITELTNKLSAAELTAIRVSANLGEAKMQLRNVDAMLAKERQAGRDEVLKELSESEPKGWIDPAGYVHSSLMLTEECSPLIIRPQPPKES